VYDQNCASCHGPEGQGGTGPRLAGEQAYTDPDVVVSQIREGGGGMPAFGDKLSAQELADVSAFVVEELAP
ncbi:MAG: cytochrome c, partial [Actinomycetota bacterium]|nr:cytochrome c [Actinomycetota bacterium]